MTRRQLKHAINRIEKTSKRTKTIEIDERMTTYRPAVVICILLRGVTWQYHAPELRDTAKDVSLFPDQPCGTHSL